jgi:predicted nucleic acid-binding protein
MPDPEGLLFDTGALIDIYRGRPGLKSRLQAVLTGKLKGYVSAITEAELWRGVRPAEVERHEAILSYFVSLPLDSGAARLAGEWMQRHEARGLGWMDALITATGVQAGLTVLTRDSKLGQLLSGEANFIVYPPGQ